MKLQKLLYYSQAWSLVWDEKPMFGERIEAWANGPVVPEIYSAHRGEFKVSSWTLGDSNNIEATEKDTINAVLTFYGDKPSQWLSDLTHREDPWRNARAGMLPGQRGNNVISLADMAEYYGGLE